MLFLAATCVLALRAPPGATGSAGLPGMGRRAVLGTAASALVGGLLPIAAVRPASAVEELTLADLPPKAQQAYKQCASPRTPRPHVQHGAALSEPRKSRP